jgi:hypothetical protein
MNKLAYPWNIPDKTENMLTQKPAYKSSKKQNTGEM